MKRKTEKETICFRHMNGQVFATAIVEVDTLEFPELNLDDISKVIIEAMGNEMIDALEIAWRTKNDRLN